MQVTIGLPFYNSEQTLLDAVRSVFAQTFQEWELILLDDGSTDGSLAIAHSIKDPRITVLSDKVNKGLSFRLNQITSLARGKYIARMDSDDIMHPTRLQEQLNFLETNHEIDLVGTAVFTMDEQSIPKGIRGMKQIVMTRQEVMENDFIIHATILARAEWFRSNPYDEAYLRAEDHELWIRTFFHTKFFNIQIPLYIVRECNKVHLHNYILSCQTDRKIYRKYGYLMVGIKKTLKLLIKSFLKEAIYRIFGIFHKHAILLGKRNASLTQREADQASHVILNVKNQKLPL